MRVRNESVLYGLVVRPDRYIYKWHGRWWEYLQFTAADHVENKP